MFSPPQKNLPPYIYRLHNDSQAGKIRPLYGAYGAGQVSSAPPVKAWWTWASSRLSALPKGTVSQPHALCELLVLGFPTLNSFSSELISKIFFFNVIKPWGNKEKIEEWRKTMAGSARRKKRSWRNLSNGCHLLANKKETIFVSENSVIA